MDWLTVLLNPLAFLAPLLFVLLTGGPFIRFLQKQYLGQYIREDGPQSHQAKAGTPTAGGVLILSSLCFGMLVLFFIHPNLLLSPVLWVLTFATLVLGGLGLRDDYLKIAKKHNKGLSGYAKLAIQALVGLGVGVFASMHLETTDVLLLPDWFLPLGWFYPVFAMLVVVATSNAVNLTDGLDGLASSTTIISLLIFSLMVSGLSPYPMSDTRLILGLFAWLLIGGTLGFFYFNRHPARIFMGDCGSLALGGALATLAILGQVEIWLLLIGGVFVMETLSVILQVLSFKTTGKRIFKMSPIHHHFELCGWHETKVVRAFILLQFLLGIGALFLYNNA
jgi:phospho-N-acetylmuramoyl-pentapeptide-transferase